jgi:PPOX class probable F420-dependent enzyme
MSLDPDTKSLAKGPNFAVLSTVGPNGQPYAQPIWVDADDDGNLLFNTEIQRQKVKNIRRDPRVTAVIIDHESPYQYVEVRGQVTDIVEGDWPRAHIDHLAQVYTGGDYPPENIQGPRVVLKVRPN